MSRVTRQKNHSSLRVPELPVTPERSENMRRVRGRDTKPEKIVRSLLHRSGYRFRVCSKELPGRPDIVFSSRRAVVLVHGCFWHRHNGCSRATIPGTRRKFWVEKLSANVKRDKLNAKALLKLGWAVFVVWECETKDQERFWPQLEAFLKRRTSKRGKRTEKRKER